jgi:transposase
VRVREDYGERQLFPRGLQLFPLRWRLCVIEVGENANSRGARHHFPRKLDLRRLLKAHVLKFDRLITAWHRSNETSMRLDALPGVGPALATALVASVPDPKAFRSGRNFSAWVGLVPKQNSSGGKLSWATSASKAIAICAACSPSAL